MPQTKQPSPQRRRLFAGAGTVGALAAAAAALPLVRPDDVSPTAEPAPPPDKGGGYQVTPHVLRYYQTART
jgi:hypothetical protein